MECISKLESLCGENDSFQRRTFDDLVIMLQKERSILLEKASSWQAAQDENFILVQQVRILSSDVSKYKLQNKGMLNALEDEIIHVKQNIEDTDGEIPMDEVVLDREVEKRLQAFRRRVTDEYGD